MKHRWMHDKRPVYLILFAPEIHIKALQNDRRMSFIKCTILLLSRPLLMHHLDSDFDNTMGAPRPYLYKPDHTYLPFVE